MSPLEIISLVLIVLGAIINFLVPQIIKKNKAQYENVENKIYTTKTIGLILVIIGCIIFFWLGGKFDV